MEKRTAISFDVEQRNYGLKTMDLLDELSKAVGYAEGILLGQVNEVLTLAIRTIKDRDALVKDLVEISKRAGGGDNLTPLGMIQTIRERFAAPEVRPALEHGRTSIPARPFLSLYTPGDHEVQKIRAITVEIANTLGVPGDKNGYGGTAAVLSLALDQIRRAKRPAGSDQTIDRLRKILEKTDAIRDDIAATIRISA